MQIFFSAAGLFIVCYLVFLSYFEWSILDHSATDMKMKPDSWTEVFRVLPVICFGYQVGKLKSLHEHKLIPLFPQCNLSWVPTYAEMNRSSKFSIYTTISISIAICCAIYTSVSVFGILTFGSKINSDLMTNYDANQSVVLIGIIAIAFKTVTSYPLLLYCSRIAIDDFCKQFLSSDNELTRRIYIVTIWFFSTILLAIEIPDITVAIDILGSLAVVFIFIAPGACLICATLMSPEPRPVLLKDQLLCLLGSLYIAFGTFLFGLTISQAILRDFIEPSDIKQTPLCI